MTLHVVTGRANSGKTDRVQELVAQAVAERLEPVVVLPSRPDVERLLDELGDRFPLGLRAVTFGRFLDDLWLTGGDGRQCISEAQRVLLLEHIAREPGASRGLVRLAGRCVAMLADQTGLAWRSSQPAVSPESQPLAALISEYARALSRANLLEQGEIAHMSDTLVSMTEGPVVFHRFTDLSGAQEALVLRLAQRRAVVVVLTWEADFEPTEGASGLASRLLNVADSFEHVVAERQYDTHPALVTVADGLFGRPTQLSPSSPVVFSEAEGAGSEAIRAAEEIARMLEDDVRPEDIALVFRDPIRHYARLKEVLDDAGIAADYDVPIPFSRVPFGRAALNLMDFAAAGRRDALLAFLRSPFSGADADALGRLEAQWRRAGTTTVSVMVGDTARLGGDCHSLLKDVVAISEEGGGAGVGVWQSTAAKMFSLAYGRAGSTLPATAELDVRAWGLLLSLLEQVRDLGFVTPTVEDIAATLAQSTVQAGAIERPGHVQVTSVARARSRRFTSVILGGLTADEFPRGAPEDLVPGGAASAVLTAFGACPEEAHQHAMRERLFFYQVLSRAKRTLVLSYQTADSDGEPTRISPFLEDVADFFRPAADESGSVGPILATVRSLSLSGNGPDDAKPVLGRRKLIEQAVLGDVLQPRIRAARARSRPARPQITDPELLEQLSDADVFSASEIERYLACPYSWFWSRKLRPEEPDLTYDARIAGTFAHTLMERLYSRMLESGILAITPASLQAALDFVEPAFAAAEVAHGLPATAAETVDRRAAKGWARRALILDSELLEGFVPQRLEWSFGFSDSECPSVDMGGYKLRGKIDRVDADADGRVVVIDYKSGIVTPQAKWVQDGLVQLPLYTEVVRRARGSEAVGALYWSLRKAQVRGAARCGSVPQRRLTRTDMLDLGDFNELVRECMSLAATAVEGIRAGAIPALPRKPELCASCPAGQVCLGGCRAGGTY